jgi:hypothetical protein
MLRMYTVRGLNISFASRLPFSLPGKGFSHYLSIGLRHHVDSSGRAAPPAHLLPP